MARGLGKDALENEWKSLSKDWYSIYHEWPRTSGISYTEWIAESIVRSFADIQLKTRGLRERNFKIADHRGQAQIQTPIEQFTEKRFLRAIFCAFR
jgi:hypothetical protein